MISPKALYAQAVQRMNDGAYPLALQSLNALCRLTPKQAEVWILLAEVQRHMGNMEASKAALNKVLEIDPGNVQALNDLKLIT